MGRPIIEEPVRKTLISPSAAWSQFLTVALTAASALFLAVVFYLPSASPLAWLALAPWLYSLKISSFRQALGLSLLWGLVFHGLVNGWIVPTVQRLGPYTETPQSPMLFWAVVAFLTVICYQSLYAVLFALLVRALLRHGKGFLLAAGISAAWMLTEWLRCLGPFGYPWCLLASSQVNCLVILQWLSVIGPFALGGLLVTMNALIVECLIDRTVKPLMVAMALLVLLLIGGWLQLQRSQQAERRAPRMSVAAVQGGFGMERWLGDVSEAFLQEVLKEHLTLSTKAAEKGAHLIVWSETAVPVIITPTNIASPFFKELFQFLVRYKVFLIAGAPTQENGLSYNAALGLWAEKGRVGELVAYRKVRLVPFGEYVPFSDRWSWLADWIPHQEPQTTPGKEVVPLSVGEEGRRVTVPVLICFESLFPQHLRQMFVKKVADDEPTLVAIITNDDWYRKGLAPYHHARVAILRAVESQRAVVRAAGTGISLIVSPMGKVLAEAPMGSRQVLVQSVPVLSGRSLYYRLGDFPFVVLAVLVIGLCLMPRHYRAVALNWMREIVREHWRRGGNYNVRAC